MTTSPQPPITIEGRMGAYRLSPLPNLGHALVFLSKVLYGTSLLECRGSGKNLTGVENVMNTTPHICRGRAFMVSREGVLTYSQAGME